ncbi:MAG: calcineurin-like phosphoesterase family protein [Prevotella sp.]|nr:calcineurin-like phosphoesterase family protein [Prevotella sp.]
MGFHLPKHLWLLACLLVQVGHVSIYASDIPDKTGMNVKGRVTCNGQGLKDVVVSDGIQTTTTNEQGIYYLQSEKKYGYVFVSLPSGYMPPMSGNTPFFYKRLSGTKEGKTDEANFELTAEDNTRYAFLAMADLHLAGMNNDTTLFRAIATDINTTASTLRQQGYSVYAFSLGDEGWDKYWSETGFKLPQVCQAEQAVDVPFFHCMGNNDNDTKSSSDLGAEQPWIQTCGPVYYSLNIGDSHIVVLDDIVEDDGNETFSITDEEYAWLQKDLAYISDKSKPLFIIMHAPLYDVPKLNRQETFLNGGNKLISLLAPYENVHILSGHKHSNYNVRQDNLFEHNTAAICGTKWYTNLYSGINLGYDGTPAGYGIYTNDSKKLSWRYQVAGQPTNLLFRSYDLNTTYLNADSCAPGKASELKKYAHGYDERNTDNEILLLVWNYDPSYTIKAEENGKALNIERVSGYDPLHILAYEVPCVRADIKPKFETKKTTNLFKIKASDATSTIDITVTDDFGNTCVEHMKRPKPFSLNSYTTTGIQATGTTKMHCCQLTSKIYNLAGMPMKRPFRGIYVSKGKKVLF